MRKVKDCEMFRRSQNLMLILLLGLYAAWTFERNALWTVPEQFCKDQLSKTPDKARAYCSCGEYYIERSWWFDAQIMFEGCVTREPRNYFGWYNLAIVSSARGQNRRALDAAATAYRLIPNKLRSILLFGDLLRDSGHPDRAHLIYREGLKYYPTNPVLQRRLTQL